jgi:hypothetical protein
MSALGDTVELLNTGEIEVLGLLPYSSNYVFLTRITSDGGEAALAVYKPTRGERPLWDFAPGSLAAREVAAFMLSEAAGWDLVPPTVLRSDAPMGAGSLQLFIEHDPERHCFVLAEERLDDLRPFAAFDAVINNADRKGGHVVEDSDGKLWGVDHGLSFNVEDKLRTVLWAFAGEPLDVALRARLQCLRDRMRQPGGVGPRLARLLSRAELAATLTRSEALLRSGRFPEPDPTQHHLPWPLL